MEKLEPLDSPEPEILDPLPEEKQSSEKLTPLK